MAEWYYLLAGSHEGPVDFDRLIQVLRSLSAPQQAPAWRGFWGSWYYRLAGKQEGPVNIERLEEVLRALSAPPRQTLVCQSGWPDWVSADKVPELKRELSRPSHQKATHTRKVPASSEKPTSEGAAASAAEDSSASSATRETTHACPSCGHANRARARLCAQCGGKLGETAASKPTLTDGDAAATVVNGALRDVEAAWPGIYQSLQDEFGADFVVHDERLAGFDLAIAVIAMDSQAITNLFPPDQGQRLRAWTRRCLNSPEWGEYALRELDSYTDEFQRGLEAPDPRDAVPAIAGRLLHRWLEEEVRRFESVVGGERTGFLGPLLLTRVFGIIASFVGRWSSLAQEYVIVEGDLPPDYSL